MSKSTYTFPYVGEFSFDYDITDKRLGNAQYVAYMLSRTNMMFEYTGLPNTIPATLLEMYLQIYGYVCITDTGNLVLRNNNMDLESNQLNSIYGTNATETDTDTNTPAINHNLYFFRCEIGGEPDIYYRPTQAIIANPALKTSLTRTIGKDCAIIKSDTRYLGLLPIFKRYAAQLTENDISIRAAQINSRQRTIISAGTDREKASADKYLENIEAGKFATIAETPFLEGIKVQNAGVQQPNAIIQLIELQQYLKASWFNELGLNSAFNMKREYLSEEEIAANTDILMPLIDNMLLCREEGISMVNKLYGTNISVKKNSAWENKDVENDAHLTEKSQSQSDEEPDKEGDSDE